jgi:dTDP-4-dehydrorhamnose reductase
MKALILGAAGQVGRALATAAPAGAEIVALDRAACDIGDAGQIERAVRDAAPDILFNAAGYTAVDKAEEDGESATRLNAAAPGLIAAAARRAGARTVHLSTDFVFDGLSSRPYRPDDATAPLSVYGRTKLDGERAAAAADPDVLIVRTAWVYAPSGANFVNTMLRLMRERERIEVVADQIGTPTRAASLASALWALALAGAAGIHHFTDAGVASWYDFAIAVEEEGRAAGLLGAPVEVVPVASSAYAAAAARPAYAVLDKQATWALLGGPPPHWRTNLRASLMEAGANG